jgi:branched-chain amino acid transport system substrate-binding protein
VRKIIAAAAAVLLLAVACGGGGDSGTNQTSGDDGDDGDDGPIRIGVVGPMTGLAGFLGKNMVEGIQLAVEDLNKAGGVLGRQVEFKTRDDEADPAKTTTAVRELIEKEEVTALFGPVGNTNYLSVARVIQDNKVPTWVISGGSELTKNVNPYAYRAFIPDTPQISALAEFAAKRYSRIAVMSSNDADGNEFADTVSAELRKHGKSVVESVKYAIDDTDHSPIVLKVKNANADAVIMGAQIGLFASRFASAARNLELNAQLLGPAGLINYTYPDLARQAADKTIFVSFRSWGHLPDDQWPKSVRNFYDLYVDRYLKDEEFSETGAYKAYSTNFLTYDMVKVWASAVEKAKSADPEKVGEVLNANFSYPAEESVIGVPWKYSKTNHDGIEPGDLYFYRWELGSDNKFTLKFHGTVTDVLAGKGDL